MADIHSRVGENREGRMETKGAASRTRRDDPVRVGAVALTFALAAAGYLALSFIRLDGLGGTSGVRIGLQPTTVATAAVALLSFSALVLPGALLALQGRGRLSALPGASYFGASVIIPLLRGWGGLGPFSWFLLYPAASLVLVASRRSCWRLASGGGLAAASTGPIPGPWSCAWPSRGWSCSRGG